MKTIIISSFILSVASITMNTLILINYDYAGIIDTFVREKGFGFFDLITKTITRMFFKSLPYTILASLFSFYFLMKKKRINWFYVINIVLCMWAIIFSYTRSIIAVTAMVAILFVAVILVINIKDYKKLLKNIGAVLAVFIIVSLAICIPVKTNYIKYAMNRVFVTFDDTTVNDANNSKINVVPAKASVDSDNVKTLSTVKQSPKTTEPTVSLLAEDNTSSKPDGHEYLDKTKNQGDTYRAETIRQQKERIKESPIFGLGLGSRIQLREHVENTHLDMIMKMGYVGFILYYLPIVYMLYLLIKEIYIDKKKKTNLNDKIYNLTIIFLSILTFVILTYFNPYMNAALGIATYVISLAVFSNMKKIFKIEVKT